MFLQKFVEQHRVYHLVAHAFHLPFVVAIHHGRVHFFHLLSDQPKTDRLRGIKLLFQTEADRFQGVKRLARRSEGSDVFLVALRRNNSGVAKSAVAQSDCNVIVNAGAKTLCQRVHIADPGGVVYRSRPKDICADADIAVARDVVAGVKTDYGVLDAGDVVVERPITGSRVGVAGSVACKRQISGGRVVGAGGVVLERLVTGGGIDAAGSIAKEGERSGGRVEAAFTIAQKRPGASGGILVSGVGKERPRADTCAEVAVGEAQERIYSDRRVVCAAGETKNGILPFRCVATWIAAVWRRADCLRRLKKR